jgi:diguanylate cyclase (GGDEF)-like protein
MSIALMLLIVYLYIPNRLAYATAIAFAATAAFLAMVLAQEILQPYELLTMTMLLVLANSFGFIAARRYKVLWREEYQAQSILRNLSMQDPLTGCYNRQYLQQSLFAPEWARARRFKLQLTVIMCDLDNFKSINDNYGHTVGDEVLVVFAKILLNTTRENIDSVVRFGGEEFLLVLPETDRAGGARLAERLREAFEKSAVSAAKTTASFGVASIDFATTGSSSAMTELIAYGDRLLYAAKKDGRNQVACGEFT